MGLINKLKKRILFKIIFFIILLLIVFNKVLIHGFQKFILQNEIKNPLELINTYIKKKITKILII